MGDVPRVAFHKAIGNDGELRPELAKKGIRLTKVDEPTLDYLGFNLQDPVLGKNRPLHASLMPFNGALDRT